MNPLMDTIRQVPQRSKQNNIPLLCPEPEVIRYVGGLWVTFKETHNMVMDVDIGSSKLIYFEWL
jgi:hypothetical protein